MALRTYEQYLESLKKMRPNIYKFDELIDDVTTHKATKRTVKGHGWSYRNYDNEQYRDLLVTKSDIDNEPISRYLSLIKSPQDMWSKLQNEKTGFPEHRYLHRWSMCRVDINEYYVYDHL